MENIDKLKIGGFAPDSLMHGASFMSEPAKITWVKTHNDAGGYYARGVIFDYIHMNFWGQTQCCRIYPWEMGVPGGAYKDPNHGWARYGYTNDVAMVHSYNDIGGSIIGDNTTKIFQAGFAVYSGSEQADANGFIDVSDNPITITVSKGQEDRFDFTQWLVNESSVEIDVTSNKLVINKFKPNVWLIRTNVSGHMNKPEVIEYCRDASFDLNNINVHTMAKYDPTNEEAWDAYMGTEHIYHKDRTVANAWIKYGIAHFDTANDTEYLVIDGTTVPEGGQFKLCDVVDFDDYLPAVRYNLKSSDKTVLNKINNYFANNYVDTEYINAFDNSRRYTGLYSNSNIDECTIKVKGQSVHCNCVFSGSTVKIINLDVKEDSVISSTQHLFYDCKELTTINFTGTPCGCNDCSGMFLGCKKLTTYPSHLINWGARLFAGDNPNTNICYFCDGASGMITIPQYNYSNRYADDNTIVCGPWVEQMFNSCGNLETVGPVIDMKYVVSGECGNHVIYGCPKLTDIKIKNLNHGDWDLTGTIMNLSSINQESAVYLINNLFNLKATGFEEGAWDKPKSTSATIKCPSAWSSWITSEMTTNASNKGWTITYA